MNNAVKIILQAAGARVSARSPYTYFIRAMAGQDLEVEVEAEAVELPRFRWTGPILVAPVAWTRHAPPDPDPPHLPHPWGGALDVSGWNVVHHRDPGRASYRGWIDFIDDPIPPEDHVDE